MEKLPNKIPQVYLQDDQSSRPKITGAKMLHKIYFAKYESVLVKAFEENGGYIGGEKLDELHQKLEGPSNGEITRRRIIDWFYLRRGKSGFDRIHMNSKIQFPKRALALLETTYRECSGQISPFNNKEKLENVAEILKDEMTRTQIVNWFQRRRRRRGLPIQS